MPHNARRRTSPTVAVHIPVATAESVSHAEHLTTLVIGLRAGGGEVREKHARDVTAQDLQQEAAWIAGIADPAEREAAVQQCLVSLVHLIAAGESIGQGFLEIAKKCETAAKQLRKLEGTTVRRTGHGPSRN